MENQEKRKQIERALDQYIDYGWYELDVATLAEQAIVIKCEVEHESSPAEKLTKVMFHDDVGSILTGLVRGHQGTEGKALAIIVSLEE